MRGLQSVNTFEPCESAWRWRPLQFDGSGVSAAYSTSHEKQGGGRRHSGHDDADDGREESPHPTTSEWQGSTTQYAVKVVPV